MNRPLALLALLSGCSGPDTKIAVYENPPDVTIVSPPNGTEYDEGEVINFQARVADDTTTLRDLELVWSSDVDGELVGGGQPSETGDLEFATANLSAGFTHTVSLQVIDKDATASTATVSVVILEVPDAPEIAAVQPAPGQSGLEAEGFEFVAQVSDSTDAPESLLVVVESDLEGTLCAPVPDPTGKASCTKALTAGVHRITFTVEDTEGFTASAVVYFTVTSLAEIDDDEDGWTETQGDCDDTNPAISPSDTEYPNGVDDDCDELIDEGTSAYDDDSDSYSEDEGDCDDTDAAISPGVTEVCGNGIDDNCDGSQDAINAVSCTNYYYDYDGDGYGSASVSPQCRCAASGLYNVGNASDCYDNNSSANPSQTAYFSTQRGDGSYDYNCDSSESKYYTTSGSCSSWPLCDTDSTGWSSGTPSCGSVGTWLDSCETDWTSCDKNTSSKTQTCK